MTDSKKILKSYDTVIVGNSPGAMVYAHALQAKGTRFCIIDSQLGSVEPLKMFSAVDQMISTDLPFQSNDQVPEFLDRFLESNPFEFLKVDLCDGPPLSLKKGKFRSFVGFDGAKIPAQDEYLRYCKETLFIAGQPETFLAPLIEPLAPFIFKDQVTDLEFDGHKITHIVLNGSQRVQAEQFVFFDRLDWLVARLAKVETSISTRLKKLKWFSAVHLSFYHPDVAALDQNDEETVDIDSAEPPLETTPSKATTPVEWNSPYILMGSKEQPCLGSFRKTDSGQTISQWQSYIPAELTMDSETTGVAVKEIKKQVKRAFPSLMTKETSEQIVVRQFDIADLQGVGEKLGNFNNLTVGSPLFHGCRGWLFEMALAWDLARGLEPNKGTESLATDTMAPEDPEPGTEASI